MAELNEREKKEIYINYFDNDTTVLLSIYTSIVLDINLYKHCIGYIVTVSQLTLVLLGLNIHALNPRSSQIKCHRNWYFW